MFELTCETNHPGDTLVILPVMGHMYFRGQPHTGYCIKTQLPRFTLHHLFHQTFDGRNDGRKMLVGIPIVSNRLTSQRVREYQCQVCSKTPLYSC